MADYTEADIDRALMEYAFQRGNAAEASRRLAAEDILTVSAATILKWAKDLPDRLENAKARLFEQLADDNELVAREYVDIQRLVLKRLRENVDELEPRDLAAAARNLATGAGISVDKASALKGRPTVITESRDVSQIMEGIFLRLTGGGQTVDATATEIPQELPEGDSGA